MVLFSITAIFLIHTIANSKPSDKNYADAIGALTQANELLKEEQTRWNAIHSNPVTDKWKVTQEGENINVDVTIDTSISNAINSDPIQRKYTIVPDKYKLWAPLDLMVSGSLISTIGFRPTFGMGWKLPFYNDFGITANTSFYNINAGVYYTNKIIPYGFVQGLLGIEFGGRITLGVGIGIKI